MWVAGSTGPLLTPIMSRPLTGQSPEKWLNTLRMSCSWIIGRWWGSYIDQRTWLSVQTVLCGHFPLLSILNANVVISPLNIEFGKDPSIFNLINEVLNKGEIGIFDGVTVDVLVILARLEASFLLTEKKEAAWGEFKGWTLSRKSSVAFCSLGVRGETFLLQVSQLEQLTR